MFQLIHPQRTKDWNKTIRGIKLQPQDHDNHQRCRSSHTVKAGHLNGSKNWYEGPFGLHKASNIWARGSRNVGAVHFFWCLHVSKINHQALKDASFSFFCNRRPVMGLKVSWKSLPLTCCATLLIFNPPPSLPSHIKDFSAPPLESLREETLLTASQNKKKLNSNH